MAVKFLYYFIFIFIGIMLFLLYQKPYDTQLTEESKNEPNIDMFDATNYSIAEDGISHIIKASRVLRFLNHDEFYNLDITRKEQSGLSDNIKADSGKLVKDNLYLEGNINYRNSDNVKLRSQRAEYNLKTEIAKIDADFVLENNKITTYGTSLVYDIIKGKINATNIKSIVREDEK
ncbi:MAG: LPS export ABC transporter periplasmic protein LptC [Sulfurospirillum sp.]|nr:LPS export ABC transporter periplasmic protein LptC [Sulfurospirillum sp.]